MANDGSEKLVGLLKTLFQFEFADVDYGIPRLMNYKRKEIQKFIETDLIQATEASFKDLTKHDQQALNDELKSFEEQINQFDAGTIVNGEVKKNKDVKKVKEYLALKAQKDQIVASKEKINEVYSRVFDFFSRYYEDGDFISKARDGARTKYRVPYNGEEVLLYWATRDQYYVKTDEQLKKHRFVAGSWHVTFTVVAADLSKNNVKTGERYFILDAKEPELDEKSKELTVYFNYRVMTEEEAKEFGTKSKEVQNKFIDLAHKKIFSMTSTKIPNLSKIEKIDETEISLLRKQLLTYVRRNTTDYFIHKNLKGFLENELDFYLKNEVLVLDDLENMDPQHILLEKAKVKAIREISNKIISFLVQIEEFQKRLWEKKKFVLKTDYIITIDRLPAELLKEVLNNKAQIKEWEELGFGKITKEKDLYIEQTQTTLSGPAKTLKFLPVDTKHFGQEFKYILLEKLSEKRSLDEQINGWLIKSENWQALKLLEGKYTGKIDVCYIDPPYNTAASEILYKNDYKNSSWLSLIENRLTPGKKLLKSTGIQGVAIDDYEYPIMNQLLSAIFGEENHLGNAVVRSNPHGRAMASGFSTNHEYSIFYSNSELAELGRLPRDDNKQQRYSEQDSEGKFTWINFVKTGLDSERNDRPKMYYPIFVKNNSIRIPKVHWSEDKNEWILDEKPNNEETVVYPIDSNKNERVWSLGIENAKNGINEKSIIVQKNKNGISLYRKYRPNQEGALPGTWWADAKYSATESGTRILKQLFGQRENFSFPKSVFLMEDCLRVMNCNQKSIAIDYFAGSGTTGHAIINLNKQDNGNRKFILVEMGEHFESVLIPRIKKILFSSEWDDGKPTGYDGQSFVSKYFVLEQYEDSLNNLTFKELPGGAQKTLEKMPDYFISYMLDYETRDSPARLNLKAFEDPFNYQLRIISGGDEHWQTVDLVETFNYLMGIEVNAFRRFQDQKRDYVTIFGTVEKKPVVVVWRSRKDLDLKKDKKFIEQTILKEPKAPKSARVFVNGDSFVTGAEALEVEFKRRMGA